MILLKQPETLSDIVGEQRARRRSIGFVPTMGALHDGHLQLIEMASLRSNLTVSSIFVNPTQFNNLSDFKKYPDTIEKDIRNLEKTRADILFVPEVNVVYPAGTERLERYDLGYLETILEGKFRPGHFQGVCQVMSRLLKMVKPDILFMGQKDFQQCMVIKKLIADQKLNIELITCPTVREPDGLAMSSRNLRLSPEDRNTATTIYQTLLYVKSALATGNPAPILLEARKKLEAKQFRVDYVALADASNLQLLDSWDGHQPAVILIAAFLNEIRLIDNLLIPS